MSNKYILKGHKPVLCNDLMKWAEWYEKADRRVAKTTLSNGVEISTVFLGLDHSFSNKSKPVLFETMIFGGKLDQGMERYSSWKSAENGHKQWVGCVLEEEGTLVSIDAGQG